MFDPNKTGMLFNNIDPDISSMKKEKLFWLFSILILIFTSCNDTPTDDQGDQLSIQISPSELYLYSDEHYHRLSVNYNMALIIWNSSDTSVVSVDSIGVVSVNGLGTATITAKAIDTLGKALAYDSIKAFVEWWKLFSLNSDLLSMVFNYVSNSIIVGFTEGKGIYRSDDTGLTWNESNTGLILNPNDKISTLAVSKTSPDIAIAVINFSEVYKSIDGGLSWQTTQSPDQPITDLKLHPIDIEVAYAIQRPSIPDSFYIFKTSTLGEEWLRVSSTPDPSGTTPSIFIDPISPQYMYIGSHNSYRSTNEGTNWDKITWPNQGPDFLVCYIDEWGRIYSQDYNWNGSGKLRLVRSSDSGIYWKVLKEYNTASFVYTADNDFPNTIIIASPSKLYFSLDDGNSWEELKTKFIGESIGIAITNLTPMELIFAFNDSPTGSGVVWEYRKAEK